MSFIRSLPDLSKTSGQWRRFPLKKRYHEIAENRIKIWLKTEEDIKSKTTGVKAIDSRLMSCH